MPPDSPGKRSAPRFIAVAAFVLLCVGGMAGAGQVRAAVFGDGDPHNGVEDGRRGISQGAEDGVANAWFRSAGTVVCDGAIRGSATLVDTSKLAPGVSGAVIATAAHVFFDLETGRPWEECTFAYLGLGEIPGYRAPLRADRILQGGFSPEADPAAPTSGSGDWAFAWLGRGWRLPAGALGLPPAPANVGIGVNDRLGLVAWDRDRRELSVTADCRAVMSGPEDLGGGAWAGQFLDDCDSGGGASGGGLIVERHGKSALVAIRGGSHWDRGRWPPNVHPAGPPQGAPWDPRGHTNWARALDEEVLARVGRWLSSTAKMTGRGASGSP